VLLAVGAAEAHAQGQAAGRAFIAEGRVSRPAEGGRPTPVRGQWVVLHRVGSDRAAPLDSVRSRADGSFRFRYRPFGARDALYFVSATYNGIAYFSPPLRSDSVSGGDADVLVFDTTTDTSTLRLQGRHFVLGAPRGKQREVVEVFEIENEGVRTVVARDSTAAIWSIALPQAATGAAVSQGDISAGAVNIVSGRAEIFAPISPGVRQLVLTYSVATDAFPFSHPLGRATSVLEVLLEEPRAHVDGAQLREVASATIESRVFRRFLAQDVPASAAIRVSAPAPAAQNPAAMRVLAVVLALGMLGAFGVWALRRRNRQPVGVMRPASQADLLIAQLATLDASFERQQMTAGDATAARQDYERERARLKERIAAALDPGNTPA
jgi:hypothetical protein